MAGYRAKPPKGARLNRADPLAEGLIGAWMLDEGAGPAARDSASLAHGTLTNSPTWTSTAYGKGLNFTAAGSDGGSSRLEAASDPMKGLSAFTVAVLLQPSSTSGAFAGNWADNSLLCRLNGAGFQGYFQRTDSTQYGGSFGLASAVAGTWYHFAVTYNGSRLAGYLNGSVGPTTYSASGTVKNTGTSKFNLGSGLFSADFAGKIAAGFIWNCAIPASGIRALYADPFRMFRRRPLLVPAAAAGGFKAAWARGSNTVISLGSR